MGRKKTNIAHEQYEYISAQNKSICKLCNEVVKGNHGTNLKKHLIRCHEFNEDQFDPSSLKKPSCSQSEVSLSEINTVKVQMSKEILIDACVELVTVNGRPFTLMDDSGFKKIMDPLKASVAKRTRDKLFSLSSESIQKYISQEANNLKQSIKEDVKNAMVSIKIDGVTRLDRSFLGINIQYVRNSRLVLRTLALKEMKTQHTGENLKRLILEVCSDFGIDVDQIYSITTDNGTNMLKAINIIASETGDYDIVEQDESVDEDENEEVIRIIIENDNEDSQTEKVISCDQNENTDGNREYDIFENMSDNFFELDDNGEGSSSFSRLRLKLKVTGMRCAAHTLQLAIDDALKLNKVISKLILEVRKVVKTLRTQTFMYMLKKQKFKKPVIDCVTRWGSTYDMFQRVLELKAFCDDMEMTNLNKFENLPESSWNKVSEVINALEPARKCTVKLQYEQLTLGSFYGYWQECKLVTEKIGSDFSRSIVRHMKQREAKLFDNDVFLAGIFLDPRYKVVLKNGDIERAKVHLKLLWSRLLALKEIRMQRETDNSNCFQQDLDVETSSVASTSSDDIEVFLKKKESEYKVDHDYRLPSSSTSNLLKTRKTDSILDFYEVEQGRIRLQKDSSIFDFWENKKESDPELYILAQILLGVPATQVSVERLFSGLKFLLPPTRSNIKEKILEEQLFVRTNRIFGRKEDKKLFVITKKRGNSGTAADVNAENNNNNIEVVEAAEARKTKQVAEPAEARWKKRPATQKNQLTNYFSKKSSLKF